LIIRIQLVLNLDFLVELGEEACLVVEGEAFQHEEEGSGWSSDI
jgi:hypothetical protein